MCEWPQAAGRMIPGVGRPCAPSVVSSKRTGAASHGGQAVASITPVDVNRFTFAIGRDLTVTAARRAFRARRAALTA